MGTCGGADARLVRPRKEFALTVLLGLVRRMASAPGLRHLTRVRALLRISFALRAHLVSEPLRFTRNELRRGPTTATYHLRRSSIAITIRHQTPDVLVLDEIFSQREYEFPRPVERALEAAGRPLAVADLGANIGLFGAWVLSRFPDARIVAFEPDPANAAVHARTIEANGRPTSWILVKGFAAGAPGTAHFRSGAFATSGAAREGQASIEVRAVDVFQYLAEIDFLKIDIEGGEWQILADPRFAQLRARAIALEYHRDGCPQPDARQAAEQALAAARYEIAPGPEKPGFGAGLLWGWQAS